MNRIALSTAAALLIASPAFAQTAAPNTQSPSAQSPSAQTPSAQSPSTQSPSAAGSNSAASNMAAGADATGTQGGMTRGTTSTVALKYVSFSPADVMASRLDDLDVYNNQNEKIGEISDLAIKNGKTISGVVVSVGGFLGIGERYVLLDPSSIVLADQNGTMRAMVNTSKDELTKAPEFKYDRD